MRNNQYNFLKHNWEIIIIIIVIFLANIAFITRESLWGDEYHTLYAVKGNFTEMMSYLLNDVHPPLYFFLMHCWTKLFGYTELF
jgi:uncharacterized membrane protein